MKMVNITLTIPDELKEQLQKHPEVNWSAVMRKSMQEHLKKIAIAEAIAQKSKFMEADAKEIGDLIKMEIAKRHRISKK
jgi:hypothetical protein